MRTHTSAAAATKIVDEVREKISPDLADTLHELLREALPAHIDPILSRNQVARTLGVSLDGLDRMHLRGEGPPRFRLTPRRWGYPSRALRQWQRDRLEAETSA